MSWAWMFVIGRALAGPDAGAPPQPVCSDTEPLVCMQQGVALRADDPAAAAQRLQVACDGGVADGCSYLGSMTAAGEIGEADPSTALALYRQACLAGSAHGCTHATQAMLSDDAAGAFALLEEACSADVASACEDLGALYATGKGVATDDAQAVELYRRSCQLSARACRQLGVRTVQGRGVDRDVAAGVSLLVRACDGGSVQACHTAEEVLLDPSQAPADLLKVASVRQAGCTAGSARSCASLGFQLVQGSGVPEDVPGGVRLLTKACEGGEGAACGGLGFHHREAGRLDEARTWFARGCEAGVDQACVDLLALNQGQGP